MHIINIGGLPLGNTLNYCSTPQQVYITRQYMYRGRAIVDCTTLAGKGSQSTFKLSLQVGAYRVQRWIQK